MIKSNISHEGAPPQSGEGLPIGGWVPDQQAPTRRPLVNESAMNNGVSSGAPQATAMSMSAMV